MSRENKKTTRGRKKRYVEILTEKEINHEWTDKQGKVHNKDMKSLQTKITHVCFHIY